MESTVIEIMICEHNTLSHLPATVTPLTVTPLTFADDLTRQLIEEINNYLDSDDNSDVPNLIEAPKTTIQK